MNTIKKSKRKLRIILFLMLCGAFTTVANFEMTQKEWIVPSAAKKMKNPTDPNDKDGLFTGKSLYAKNCKSCHGKSGRGDGPSAKELKTFSGDFTAAEFAAQTDGELFFKIREGRDDMPTFKKLLPEDENVWFVVNYIRTLEKD